MTRFEESNSDDPLIAAIVTQLELEFPAMPAQDRVRFANSVRGGEPYAPGVDAQRRDDVPRGTVIAGTCPPGRVYPDVEHGFHVYVSSQYGGNADAGLLVFLDGSRYLGPECDAPAVLDNMVHAGELPPVVAVFVQPGAQGPGLPIYGGSDNRSIEYDSLGDACVRFLLDELLPLATRGLRISADPAWRAVCGLSSGGACAFNAAFERPDAFGNVISHCGSFVDIRGGDRLAGMVRRAPRKPLRVFLQTGAHDLDIVFGNWLEANRTLAAALAYRGYDHRLVVGEGGHSLAHGGAILPDTLRWLWRNATPPAASAETAPHE